jgi:hypothetical protein
VLGDGGLSMVAKERRRLDQVYVYSRVRQIQGCLDTGNRTANYECTLTHETIPHSRIFRIISRFFPFEQEQIAAIMQLLNLARIVLCLPNYLAARRLEWFGHS